MKDRHSKRTEQVISVANKCYKTLKMSICQLWTIVSISKKWSSQPYPGISSSYIRNLLNIGITGPRRIEHPCSFAYLIDSMILSLFPPKSNGYWLSPHAAIFTKVYDNDSISILKFLNFYFYNFKIFLNLNYFLLKPNNLIIYYLSFLILLFSYN